MAARSYQLLSGDRWLPNVGGIVAFGVVLLLFLRSRRMALLAVGATRPPAWRPGGASCSSG